MPRKYRPPAARRRKSKRPPPYFVEPVPGDGDLTSGEVAEAVSVAEPVPATPVLRAKPSASLGKDGGRAEASVTRHISRDYSYVRAEVKRIVFVAGILIVSLIITAILRN